jgi:hypothetical protein
LGSAIDSCRTKRKADPLIWLLYLDDLGTLASSLAERRDHNYFENLLNTELNPTLSGEKNMSRIAKRTRSLVITLFAIAVTNIAISYASGVPIIPDSPKPKSGVPIIPDSPKPKSGVPIIPDSPKPKSGVPIIPDSPKPRSGVPIIPDSPKP